MDYFNYKNFCQLIDNLQWTEASEEIKSAFKLHKKDDKFTTCNSRQDIKNLELILEKDISNTDVNVEVYRALRNCVISFENQNYVIENTELLKLIKDNLAKSFSSENKQLSKLILQFLTNLIASNKTAAKAVFNEYNELILHCLGVKVNDYEIFALFYYLLLQCEINFSMKYYCFIKALNSENSCEFVDFITEIYLLDENFWTCFKNFNVEERIAVLEILKNLWLDKKLKELPEICLKTLSDCFSFSNNVIFQTVSESTENKEPYEVSLLLDIIGSLCSNENYLKYFQSDKELVIRSGVILINVHRLGKASENYFSSVQKLSEVKEASEVIKKHPAFGFKVSLVKLIGNLCWKSKQVQDLVREAEIIPVLLDCCNIDARNPLIMQWVIFAIRNICENNQDNQEFISSLHHEGTVSSALLEEMGITLHGDESGKIKIVPLNLH